MAEPEFRQLNEDFILELYRTCLNNKTLLEIANNNLKFNFLPEEVHKEVFREIKAQYSIDGKIPTVGTLKVALRKDRKALDFLDLIKNTDPADPDVLISGFEDFIKQSRFVELYDDVGKLYNQEKKAEAYRNFIKGAEEMSRFTLANQQFEQVFGEDFAKRQSERVFDNQKGSTKVRTGIDELDRVLKGGPELQEYVLFVAEAKAGKSFCLAHVGMAAARRGLGVAHFQAEGTRKQVMNRYDSAWAGVSYHDVKIGDMPGRVWDDHEKIIASLGKGNIHVYAPEKFLAMTVGDIRQKIINLKKEYDIKVVVLDYLELVNPDNDKYGAGDERFRQQKVSRMLKDLAVEQDVLLYSATQTSNISREMINDDKFVITRDNLSEDKGKVRPVDLMISINRTHDERLEKICRLYTDAAREYDSNDVIYIKQNLKYSRFYDRKATMEAFELMS